jgi:hypothetical protein
MPQKHKAETGTIWAALFNYKFSTSLSVENFYYRIVVSSLCIYLKGQSNKGIFFLSFYSVIQKLFTTNY